jgi:hypothetical protein
VAAAPAATVALLLAGCGTFAPSQGGAAETGHPANHLSVSDFAVVVLAATESAGSVHTERVETARGRPAKLIGDALFDRASYRGRITLVPRRSDTNAAPGRNEIRLVSGRVFVHVPGRVPPGEFLSQDLDGTTPALGGLCVCLFSLMEPTTMLQNMRQSLTGVEHLGRDRSAGPSLEHYRLRADTTMIPGAVDATHPPTTRVYQVWLDSRHLIRRMTYSTLDKAVDVTYSHWGERVHVQRPAAAKTHRVPGAGGGTET